ncbi:MAG: hypothetical protein JO010_06640 [Alphaproteobacteria bacterium]|nr:hypothetical protein [Alphaproteobacteria bacterium]
MPPWRLHARSTGANLTGKASREIEEFLRGLNSGERLLHAIYDRVLEEPVPARLTKLIRRCESAGCGMKQG